MKRLCLLSVLIAVLIVFPLFGQNDEDMEIARAQDYTEAILKKTPEEKVEAFKAYIQKYPETSQKFTKLAYYMLTVSYFHVGDYVQTARTGEKTMTLGDLPNRGEQARLYLVTGNAYAVKSASIYDKEKAMDYVNRAITLARGHDNEVLSAAQNLKKSLTGPPPKQMTPEQKIKMLVHQDSDYNGAISFYRGLGGSDKSKPEIHETYAVALLKSNRLDQALQEFTRLHSTTPKGKYAKNIAEVYAAKAKRDKSFFDKVVDMYIEAALLFRKEGDMSKYNAALKLGQFQLFEKYDFNDKIKRYNAMAQQSKSSAAKAKAEIDRYERELRKHMRHLRNTYEYNDLDPPDYEIKKQRDLERKIARLKSGGSAESDAEGEKLLEEKRRIEREFNDRVSAKRTAIG